MDLALFEELAPVCPRCLHGNQTESPLVVAERFDMRGERLWAGVLHCSNAECWAEYPVIDGIPILVADPASYINNSKNHILARTDLPETLEGLLGDAQPQGEEFDRTRNHLSIYASSHFADWAGGTGTPDIVAAIATGLDALGALPDGPVIDVGGSVGRGGWELAARTGRPVVVGDLNFSMLQLAQQLLSDGEATFPNRRVGVVYDRVKISLPTDMPTSGLDFWAMDALALPFVANKFALSTAINLVDCIPGPTDLIIEMARSLCAGGGALVATPFDWSTNATPVEGWMGGHSQRGTTDGASEPILKATMERHGLAIEAEIDRLPWNLRLHARSVMQYEMYLLAARRGSID